jgi:DNA-directed RNA polymerase subunit RPC12/RpoP
MKCKACPNSSCLDKDRRAEAGEDCQFDESREVLGAEGVDRMLTSLGFGPGYVPTPPKLYDCPSCGGHNAVIKERHPDTDMNHMALVCPDCKHEEER